MAVDHGLDGTARAVGGADVGDDVRTFQEVCSHDLVADLAQRDDRCAADASQRAGHEGDPRRAEIVATHGRPRATSTYTTALTAWHPFPQGERGGRRDRWR